ncbi:MULTISPECIES: hypothetical protein [Hafnia]|uniref:hypothetical protein n=1 Tax=Hafnia TaxID=568 RepID=UPI0008FEFF80|nr:MULTISPECIES: hypothetical protein [Hafnia]QQE41795.1 hypothetical protein I6H95_12235 [Hafnia alvei]
MSLKIPNSGKQIPVRNKRTGSPWLASFNYITGLYHFQPIGNARFIKREFESIRIPIEFELAGTINGESKNVNFNQCA